MTKRYVEVTIAYEDDPATNPARHLEVSSRSKEEEAGEWSDARGDIYFAPVSGLQLSWLELQMKKV